MQIDYTGLKITAHIRLLKESIFEIIITLNKSSMGNNMVHCLMMSGMVLPAKRKEFEQTFRFVFNQLLPGCLQYSLSADIFTPNQVHFYSLWPTAESLDSFCKSQEFQVLEGAYRALGSLEKETTGELVDIKAFHITNR